LGAEVEEKVDSRGQTCNGDSRGQTCEGVLEDRRGQTCMVVYFKRDADGIEVCFDGEGEGDEAYFAVRLKFSDLDDS